LPLLKCDIYCLRIHRWPDHHCRARSGPWYSFIYSKAWWLLDINKKHMQQFWGSTRVVHKYYHFKHITLVCKSILKALVQSTYFIYMYSPAKPIPINKMGVTPSYLFTAASKTRSFCNWIFLLRYWPIFWMLFFVYLKSSMISSYIIYQCKD